MQARDVVLGCLEDLNLVADALFYEDAAGVLRYYAFFVLWMD